MRLRIRIYPNDTGLYYIYNAIGQKEFKKIVKNTLISYVTNKSYDIPKIDVSNDVNYENTVINLLISISDTRYPEVVSLLKTVLEDKKTNIFIKHLLNIYLSDAILNLCIGENYCKYKSPVIKSEIKEEPKKQESKQIKIKPAEDNKISSNTIEKIDVIENINTETTKSETETKEPEQNVNIFDLFASVKGL